MPTTVTADSIAERYHYSLFMCCQGMYQMGSPYWEQFFPRMVRAVLAHQQPDGSWDVEGWKLDRRYGKSYTTALVILALGARINSCRFFRDEARAFAQQAHGSIAFALPGYEHASQFSKSCLHVYASKALPSIDSLAMKAAFLISWFAVTPTRRVSEAFPRSRVGLVVTNKSKPL